MKQLNILTPLEAAEFLRISRPTLDRLKRTKKLEGTYFYVGTRLLYIRRKLEEWAEAGGTAQFSA